MSKTNKPRICRTCGTAYTGWRCPKCKPKRQRSIGSAGGNGRRFNASRVLSNSSPVGPINPSACPQTQDECPFFGFTKERCFCPPHPKRPLIDTEHDALIDRFLNRVDAETPMLDMVFEREGDHD